MRARITVLAAVVLSGNPTAAPADYAVDGLAVGTQLNFDSALYREYKCSTSDQFDGLTWCQIKTKRQRATGILYRRLFTPAFAGRKYFIHQPFSRTRISQSEGSGSRYTAIFGQDWRVATHSEDATSKRFSRGAHRRLGQDYAGATGPREHQGLG